MKRFAAIFLCLLTVLSLTACSGGDVSADIKKVDLSGYPEDFSDWTLENVMQYFTDAGVFAEESWKYVAEPSELGLDNVSRAGSYMSKDDESVTMLVYSFETADNSSVVAEHLAYVKDNKTMFDDDTWSAEEIDHLFGNFAIHYSLSSDETFKSSCEAAYEQLIADMSVTPEF